MTDETSPARRGIRFDRRHPDRLVDPDVADEMMMAWRERNPGQWGYWHAAALTGVEPAKNARPARPPEQ